MFDCFLILPEREHYNSLPCLDCVHSLFFSAMEVPEEAVAHLDPSDWAEFRRLAHTMVDGVLDRLVGLREKPEVWQPVPDEVRSKITDEQLPVQPQGAEEAYKQFLENVMPYPQGNTHPRFFGWVEGGGTPLGVMADMLAAGLNPHMAGFDQAPVVVEMQVIRWFIQLMGFPEETSSGLLVLGGSIGNTLGLAVARNAKAGFDVRQDGLMHDPSSGLPAHPRLTVYGSVETHSWAKKAVALLGLGESAFRQIPVDSEHRIDLTTLKKQLKEDRDKGMRPICVIGNAGTVSTGAVDDFKALAALCKEEDLWFHVDGAIGALISFSDKLRPIIAGMEDADSVSFDCHKWMQLPNDVACLLIRDRAAHEATFAGSASYLSNMTRGTIKGGLPFAHMGIDLTRAFRALKVWMSMKAHGKETYARMLEKHCMLAQALASKVKDHPDELELLAPVHLNIVCLRYRPKGITDNSVLNPLNEELLMQMQESGVAVPSQATLLGRFALRCCILNHRTTMNDIDIYLSAVLRIGSQLAASRGL